MIMSDENYTKKQEVAVNRIVKARELAARGGVVRAVKGVVVGKVATMELVDLIEAELNQMVSGFED